MLSGCSGSPCSGLQQLHGWARRGCLGFGHALVPTSWHSWVSEMGSRNSFWDLEDKKTDPASPSHSELGSLDSSFPCLVPICTFRELHFRKRELIFPSNCDGALSAVSSQYYQTEHLRSVQVGAGQRGNQFL